MIGEIIYILTKENRILRAPNLNCELDLEKSAFMEPTEENFQLQPFSPTCKLTRWQTIYNHERSLECLSKLDGKF